MSALLADALVLLGCAGLTVALVGVVRLPDTPSRVHAASAGVYLGVMPILLAAPLVADGPAVARATLIAAWLALTPVAAGHAIVRACFARDQDEQQMPPERAGGARGARELLALPQRVSLDSARDFLAATPLFESLDQAEVVEVLRTMHVATIQSGERVFREGDPADAWFVIYEGRAQVLKELSGGAREIALLFPGTCFGQLSILDRSARSVSVRAVGTLIVFRFRRQDLDELLEQGSIAAHKLVAAMARAVSVRHRRLLHQLLELFEPGEPSGQPSGQIERARLSELIGRYETGD